MGPYSQQNGTAIQRNWSSNFHSHQCFESRNLEAKKWQEYHSLQWRLLNTDLTFQTINSVNQVSTHAALTNCCYNFALKKEEKEHILTHREQSNYGCFGNRRSGHVDIFSEPSTGKPDAAEWGKIQSIEKEGSHDPINNVKKPHSNILSQQEVATKFDQMEKTDGDKSHLHAENILVLESLHKPNRWRPVQQALLLDRSKKFILWKFLTNIEWK